MNSLGFDKAPADTRVVVAMSGGVDSSVVAAMLHEEGYQVIGITLQLYDHGQMLAKKGACCAGADIRDAQRVAETLGIPHYVLNYESKFKEGVMDDFAESYLAGETPIPCVKCNQTVKFRDLLKEAQNLGADCMATGHYVQRMDNAGRAEMHRAADPTRDQSYFLFATTQEQLDFLRFPLGHLKSKEETRALAAKYGLQVADKPDSQDICFVPNGDYAKVIEKLRPGALEAGEIVHVDGTVLGQHDGIINYTVGQRRGLGIGGGDPLYVVKLDADKKQVIVGGKDDLLTKNFKIRECNWLSDMARHSAGRIASAQNLGNDQKDPAQSLYDSQDDAITIKTRSTQTPVPAEIKTLADGTAEVLLLNPQAAISPGQACVAYDGERMLGGGWIMAA